MPVTETLKRIWRKYSKVIFLILILSIILPLLLREIYWEKTFAPKAEGELIVMQGSKIVSRTALNKCGGENYRSRFILENSPTVGIIFTYDEYAKTDKVSNIEFYEPPQGRLVKARSCVFKKTSLIPALSFGNFALPFRPGGGGGRHSWWSTFENTQFWVGNIEWVCELEATDKTLLIRATFQNCPLKRY